MSDDFLATLRARQAEYAARAEAALRHEPYDGAHYLAQRCWADALAFVVELAERELPRIKAAAFESLVAERIQLLREQAAEDRDAGAHHWAAQKRELIADLERVA